MLNGIQGSRIRPRGSFGTITNKQATRDATLFQTDSAKLQKKVIAEELNYDNVVKYGLAFEQGEKKVEQMRAQSGGVRQE